MMQKEPVQLETFTQLPKEIIVSENGSRVIMLKESAGTCDFKIEQNCEVNLTLVFLPSTKKTQQTFNINFLLAEHANLNLKIANLTNFDTNDNICIKLNEPNSLVEFYSATILNKKIAKKSLITVQHLARQTSSNIKAYEVLKNESQGFIRCVSDIREKSSGSEAHQELRLLVLDKEAKADSDPVLLIDENDIVASHANAIGMLDPDQVFYLKSRGLNDVQAQELIINGFFEPVFLTIEDEKTKEDLKTILKGMI